MRLTAGYAQPHCPHQSFLSFQRQASRMTGAQEKWLESLMRPDNDRHSERQFDLKSLFCYGEADIVRQNSKSKAQGVLASSEWLRQ